MKKLINLDYSNPKNNPMFLGEGLGIQRYDQFKYEYLYRLYQQQLGQFWRPEEVSLIKDRVDFKKLDKEQQFVFVKNLAYQTILDTDQARGLRLLAEYTSIPELELFINVWLFFEQIHSESYTHIIRNVLPDTDEFWEETLKDKELLKRVKSTTEEYDKLLNINTTDTQKLKESIFDLVVAINILESIRFFVSFACSFSFVEQSPALMEGNAKIIQLILHDENIHCISTQYILKKWREREDEGFTDIWKTKENKVYEMYYKAVQEEIEWAKYLFKDNPKLLGLNEKILERYMKWLTDKRLKQIGLKPIFNEDKENPMSWIEKYNSKQQINVAPQESELESYNIGQYVNDLDVSKDKLAEEFKLDF